MNRCLVSYLESRAEVISADSYSLNDFNVFDFVKDGELVASVSGKTFNYIKKLSTEEQEGEHKEFLKD